MQPDSKSAEAGGIYIASKAVHGREWREWRAVGHPIIATWIDEAEAGRTTDWADLWSRCVSEASRAAVTIVYREEGEELKGARVEAGAALAHGRKVLVVGDVQDSWTKHPNVTFVGSINVALSFAALQIRDAATLTPAPPEPPAGMAEVERAIEKFGNACRYTTGVFSVAQPGDQLAHDAAVNEEGLRQSLLSAVRSILTRAETAEAARNRDAQETKRLSARVDLWKRTSEVLQAELDTMRAALASLRAEREVPAELVALSEKATAGEWRVEQGTTLVWGDCLIAEDGSVDRMGVPVLDAQHARNWSKGQPNPDATDANAALSASAVNFVRTLISAQKEPRNG